MIIIPPNLLELDQDRYVSDLDYRAQVDQENISERYLRIRSLLHNAPYPFDY